VFEAWFPLGWANKNAVAVVEITGYFGNGTSEYWIGEFDLPIRFHLNWSEVAKLGSSRDHHRARQSS
jgi:hypothetical protein